MLITTTYKTNANGRSQILAKGAGKQKTVNFDPSKSSDWNHGNAAGTLALVLVQGETARKQFAKHVNHTDNGGGKHTFRFAG